MARKSNKVIVTCALTGAIHTPSLSPALPITPDEIATQAIDAAKAGASILHLHARNPENGVPSGNPDLFMEFLPQIKEATDAVINITTGGGLTMTVEERLAAAMRAKPEMCSLNMGSMNFALHPLAAQERDWKYDWEKNYLLASEDFIFRNTFKDIAKILGYMGEHGTRFECECYDVGHLYNLAHFLDRKLIKPPLFVQTIFGILGGIGPEQDNLVFMRRTADRLFGDDYVWSVLGAGRHQLPLTTLAATMGGHVRVGLEDNLYVGKGQLAKDNAELVTKIRTILGELSLEIATPAETRQMLELKGANNVGF